MAPSGNAIPQRFRSRPSPTLTSSKETTEMNVKWDELLDRRQICKERYSKERYRNIKKELEDATDALTQIGKKKEDKLQNPPVIKLDAFSFIPSERSSRNQITKSSRNVERNSKFVDSISSKVCEDNGSRKSSSRFSDRSSISSDLSSRFSCDRSSREVSSGFVERSSRGRDSSSDQRQFGSRFTERCSRVQEPSSDRIKYGSRFTEQRSSSKVRDQSSDRINYGSRFTEQRSSSKVRDQSSNGNGSKLNERSSRENRSSDQVLRSSDQVSRSSDQILRSPDQFLKSSDQVIRSSKISEKRTSSDSLVSSHSEPFSYRSSLSSNTTEWSSKSSNFQRKSPAKVEPANNSISDGSRSSKSSVIFPMHSFEEAAKNANNSRTLVDKVERNADVPTGKTTKVEVGVIGHKNLTISSTSSSVELRLPSLKYHDIDFLRASDWHQCYEEESALHLPKPAGVSVEFTACQLVLALKKRVDVLDTLSGQPANSHRLESIMAPTLIRNQELQTLTNSKQPEIYECDDSCEEWEYDESPMLLPGLLSRTKFRNEYLSDPYVKETCLNLHGKVEVTNAVRNWVQKMCDKNNALVTDLNSSLGLKNVEIIEEPYLDEKLEISTGYTQVSRTPDGIKNGYYRKIIQDTVTEIGLYKNGESLGPVWYRLEGDAYKVTYNDEYMTYLYPDCISCIHSELKDGSFMTNGKFGKVQDFHQNGGLPLPLVQLHDVSDTYNYDISSYLRIAKNPLLRDPYEQQTTYIGPSGIHPEAGEGLFAKRALPKGTLIAIFNGVRKRDIEYGHNVTQLVHSPYKIALKRGVDLDIPDSAISARKYCATLAHKASHSFTPNSGFQIFEHVRFGKVMSIVSERSIEAHEEIFVNYNYRVWQAPSWYQEQWVHFKRDIEKMPEEAIFDTICKMKRNYGVTLPFPNPHKNSERFAPCATCQQHISLTEASLSCDICDQWHHVSCTPVSVDNYTGWTCKRCARHLSSRSISQDR